MIQQKITEIAEILGWSVDFSESQNGKTDVNFAKYTSYGQDFNFSVELEDDDMEAFIDNIHEYYENFDVDEEAYIWIGSDGHGKNGALYHPKLFRQRPLRHSAPCFLAFCHPYCLEGKCNMHLSEIWHSKKNDSRLSRTQVMRNFCIFLAQITNSVE